MLKIAKKKERLLTILRKKSGGYNVTANYYEMIIGGEGIKRYRKIIQYGEKAGQSLANHIENMVGVIEAVKKICTLTQEEEKVLLTAITIHDINKVPEYKEKVNYLSIISEKDLEGNYINLVRECELLGLDKFFPEYQEYIEDIRELIGRHSAHLHNYAENLFFNSERKLKRDRLEILVELIRAADVLDLSKTLDEEEKKRQFLGHINTAIMDEGVQYRLVSHMLSEDRGILTNIIHNGVVEFLESKGLIPLIYYKEGTVYLVDAEYDEVQVIDDKDKMISKICTRIKQIVVDEAKSFIRNSNTGIKIDEKCLEIASTREIIEEMYYVSKKTTLAKMKEKNNSINEIVEKYKDVFNEDLYLFIEADINKLKSKITGTKEKKEKSILNKQLIIKEQELRVQLGSKTIQTIIKENKLELSFNEEKIRFSIFLNGIYNFISSFIATNSIVAWSEFYNFFDIDKQYCEFLNLIPGNKAGSLRPYIIGEMVFDRYSKNIDELVERLVKYCETRVIKKNNGGSAYIWSCLYDYIERNLIFSFEEKKITSIKSSFNNYSNKKVKKCCLCSNEYKTQDWMKDDVPNGIGVKTFSNKLVAGSSQPSRKVCAVCHIEYLVHRKMYYLGGEVSRRYLSLLPRNFQTGAYISSIRNAFNEFKYKGIGALNFNTYTVFTEVGNTNTNEIVPLFIETKMYGVGIPKYSEVLGNYLIMPIQLSPKSREIEVWINSLLHALVFNQYFNSKIVISELPLALFKSKDIDEIYIDSIPVCYKNLFEKKWTKKQCLKVITLFIKLYELAKVLDIPEYHPKDMTAAKFVCAMLIYLNTGEAEFIYQLYKILKKKYDKPSNKINSIKDIVEEILKYIKEGDDRVSTLKELAVFASENYLYGNIGNASLKDNSINKPLTIIMDSITKSNEEIYSKDDIRALCKREVEKYFERTNPDYFRNKKIDNINKYVDLFIDKLLNDDFNGNINKLDRDRKKILSIYSYYFRANKSSEKEEK